VPELSLGPLLRHAGPSDATVWVETDSPCEVEVIVGRSTHSSRTFRVGDHHYALVRVEDLEPGSSHEYSVRLDGERAWPEAGYEFPPPRHPHGGRRRAREARLQLVPDLRSPRTAILVEP
jgi:hypothetical protein